MSTFQELLCQLYTLYQNNSVSWNSCEMESCLGLHYFDEFENLDEFKVNAVGLITKLTIHATSGVCIEVSDSNLELFDILYATAALFLQFKDGTVISISYS